MTRRLSPAMSRFDQPVQPCHERGLERARDGADGQHALKHPAPLCLAEPPRLQHRRGQLLDEQRHPVGAPRDRLLEVGRQRLAAADLADDGRAGLAAQAFEHQSRQPRTVGERWPSGRLVKSRRTRVPTTRSSRCPISSSEVGSIQGKSSNRARAGRSAARPRRWSASAASVRTRRCRAVRRSRAGWRPAAGSIPNKGASSAAASAASPTLGRSSASSSPRRVASSGARPAAGMIPDLTPISPKRTVDRRAPTDREWDGLAPLLPPRLP